MSSPASPIVIRTLAPDDVDRLGDLFESLGKDPEAVHFRPHPLTRSEAKRVACELTRGSDIYFVASNGDRFLGYGMLRGWDEGYSVPSFGVAVAPGQRGSGIGRQLLERAIEAARDRGSTRMMLKVHPDNVGALHLYESVGFVFDELAEDGVQMKGVLEL